MSNTSGTSSDDILNAWNDIRNGASPGQEGDEIFNNLYGPSTGNLPLTQMRDLRSQMDFLAIPPKVRLYMMQHPSQGEGEGADVPSEGGAKHPWDMRAGAGVEGEGSPVPLQEQLQGRVIPPELEMQMHGGGGLINPVGMQQTPLGAMDTGLVKVRAEGGGNPLVTFRQGLDSGKYDAPGATSSGGTFFDSLANIESNNKDVYSGVDKDYPGQPGSRSQGFFQIDTPTWQQFASQAGVDTSKYMQAKGAPREIQQQVVAGIPLARFGPRTQRMLMQEYGQLDPHKTIGQLATEVGNGHVIPPNEPSIAARTGAGNAATGGGEGGQPVNVVINSPAGPQGAMGMKDLMAMQMKMQLLQGMFPQHTLTPVSYNPFQYVPQERRRVNVNEGVG